MRQQFCIPTMLLASVVMMHGTTSAYRMGSASIYATPMIKKLELFAFNLYRSITEEMATEGNVGENFVFSPISIFSALSLVGRGTDSQSRYQLMKAMHVRVFKKVLSYVAETFKENEDFHMSMAQRIFISNSLNITKGFKDFLKYKGMPSVKQLDFERDPEFCRQTINNWVSHNTMDQIEELLDEDQVTALTRIYIVNAIALEAPWYSKFDPASPGSFYTSPGERISTDMMRSSDMSCMFTESRQRDDQLKNTTILVLPFKGDKLTFIAVMPNRAGDFTEIDTPEGQAKLTRMLDEFWTRTYGRNNAQLMFRTCDVTIPKFKINYNYGTLKDDLVNMGVENIFDARADLTRLYKGSENLYVSDVSHQATFSLDEDGVKATAATGFGLSARMMPLSVTINKPFIFFIRSHHKRGSILFMGKVVNPSLH